MTKLEKIRDELAEDYYKDTYPTDIDDGFLHGFNAAVKILSPINDTSIALLKEVLQSGPGYDFTDLMDRIRKHLGEV